MKALTLWQPWASLVACGAKKFETRNWRTSYRGPLAIHAAKRRLKERHMSEMRDILAWAVGILRENGSDQFYADDVLEGLPYGCILAVCELGAVTTTGYQVPNLHPDERLFGDWSIGRFAWPLLNVEQLARPVPWRGRQGLWNLPDDRCEDQDL